MSKLAPIAILIAVLTIAAAAGTGYGARPHHFRTVRSCLQGPVFPPGRTPLPVGPGLQGRNDGLGARPGDREGAPVPSGKCARRGPALRVLIALAAPDG